ncbi:hypothetical protein [Mesorhizobium sp. CAU 1741]|uniref:hypothetical protein n=1 Tax=Mesorhizobium sp. CAU 1741 TaxID=3140366 RepID=UPI00325B5708
MSILHSIVRYTVDYRTRRRRMNTYLEIASLPLEIQKDIGWTGNGSRFDDGVQRR